MAYFTINYQNKAIFIIESLKKNVFLRSSDAFDTTAFYSSLVENKYKIHSSWL
jgi:hypothetical protein